MVLSLHRIHDCIFVLSEAFTCFELVRPLWKEFQFSNTQQFKFLALIITQHPLMLTFANTVAHGFEPPQDPLLYFCSFRDIYVFWTGAYSLKRRKLGHLIYTDWHYLYTHVHAQSLSCLPHADCGLTIIIILWLIPTICDAGIAIWYIPTTRNKHMPSVGDIEHCH
jgi:hypothetical protein